MDETILERRSGMKHNPDDRSDNVERIQFNIDNTIRNIDMAEDIIAKTDDPKTKIALKEKNERREEALDRMRVEIRDEALDRERGYE
jgi:small acid-soluble spore protein (thioredoxin-like protein)